MAHNHLTVVPEPSDSADEGERDTDDEEQEDNSTVDPNWGRLT